MAVKNEGLPDLEGYLEERGRHLVTYTEGAAMYHIPYYSFARLAKEAGANLLLRRTTVIDVDILEDYETIGKSKMISVLNEMITGKTRSKSVHFTEKKLRKYFSSNYTVSDMEKIMIRLLEKWKSEQEGGNNGI